MKLKNKIILVGVAFLVAFSFGLNSNAHAKTGDQGVDWSKYQGAKGKFGYSSDKFAIAQIGGYYNGSFVVQSTYATQIQYAIAQGKRAHTYIYAQFSTKGQADQMLNYYLPKVQTPKGSIVALDVESGSPNTTTVKYALNKIKKAGYTAVLYGYKNFLTAHLNLSSLAKAYPLWLAEYPNYQVTKKPNYNFFPSYNNVQIFQFTSTYIAGGLDGDIDLTGITDNGYKGTTTSKAGGKVVKPKTTTPAIKAGKKANATPKSDIVKGDTVKVNLSAKKWATGQAIASFAKGVPYKVLQVSGKKVLLANVLSWANKSDVEILSVGKPVKTSAKKVTSSVKTYTVKSGDTVSGIAAKYGITTAKIKSLNKLANVNYIYVGERLKVSGSTTKSARKTYYTIKYGDTLSYIASKYSTTTSKLRSLNGIRNANLIYVGQKLRIK
ncbi:LysM peptidoglycan-binding domain-containing protein [Pediococcus ethanolidurans]